ncbi:MAG: type II toxin-antitoxin system prevent-host-death family antitoxin [Patescibacteria group bacterium]|jgi:prevent-host-death family protein
MSQAIPNIIGIAELQRKAPAILKQIASDAYESIVVNHNIPKAVIMSLARYEQLKALETLEFIPHRKTSPTAIRSSLASTGLYSEDFLNDVENGLNKAYKQ